MRFEDSDIKFLNVHPEQIASGGFDRSKAPPTPWWYGRRPDGPPFFAWAATTETDGLSGRFMWAEWDIEELKAKKAEILDEDLLLLTVDGFTCGF